MRGKLNLHVKKALCFGITPAHAGKTQTGTPFGVFLRDHPRACGENIASVYMSRSRRGSPPRMRGKPSASVISFLLFRITPAHAGKTFVFSSWRQQQQDHPRACGENLGQLRFDTSILGSPPRMRGKPLEEVENCAETGITPAHAGKTNARYSRPCFRKDHPRACGENLSTRFLCCGSGGSPPRMRGKLDSLSHNRVPTRITPAHAGKTYFLSISFFCAWDHPRACGENDSYLLYDLEEIGSPPRMRGKRDNR